jgi:hypothetical protein
MKAIIFLFFLITLTLANFEEKEIGVGAPLVIMGPKYTSDSFQTINITIKAEDEYELRYDLYILFLDSFKPLVTKMGSNIENYLTVGTPQFKIEINCIGYPSCPPCFKPDKISCSVLLDYRIYTYDFMTIG